MVNTCCNFKGKEKVGKKAPLGYTCTLTVAKKGGWFVWCMYEKGKGGGGVYISMKCDNKSYRMFKYRYVKQ